MELGHQFLLFGVGLTALSMAIGNYIARRDDKKKRLADKEKEEAFFKSLADKTAFVVFEDHNGELHQIGPFFASTEKHYGQIFFMTAEGYANMAITNGMVQGFFKNTSGVAYPVDSIARVWVEKGEKV